MYVFLQKAKTSVVFSRSFGAFRSFPNFVKETITIYRENAVIEAPQVINCRTVQNK